MNERKILGTYADKGFTLKEFDVDFLELYFKDSMIAVFSQQGAQPREIRKVCKNYLKQLDDIKFVYAK